MSDLEQLARFRVAIATGRLPRDLGDWALARLTESLSAADRMRRRNALLREAAARIDGSLWAKARAVHELLECFRTYPALVGCAWYPPGSPEQLVQEAMRIDATAPTSLRHLINILR